MRAKFVNEKFTEGGNPIKDMGIGIKGLIKRECKKFMDDDSQNVGLAITDNYNSIDNLFLISIEMHNVKFVSHLLECGANIHILNNTDTAEIPLRYAFFNDDYLMVKCLLEHGAIVSKSFTDKSELDNLSDDNPENRKIKTLLKSQIKYDK